MALDVLEVGEGASELPAVDGLGGLASVLVRDTEVGAAGARGLGRLDVGGGVADLGGRKVVLVFGDLDWRGLMRWRRDGRWCGRCAFVAG